MNPVAKYLIAAGLVLVMAGVVYALWGQKLHWIGRLPGDIRIEKEHFRFYFPITTLILFSLLVQLIRWLWLRFFG